jgi:hypothetical protein
MYSTPNAIEVYRSGKFRYGDFAEALFKEEINVIGLTLRMRASFELIS